MERYNNTKASEGISTLSAIGRGTFGGYPTGTLEVVDNPTGKQPSGYGFESVYVKAT